MSVTSDLLEKSMIDLVLEFPVYSELITRIGVQLVRSDMDALAWTDGKGIYINETKVEELNEKGTIVNKEGKTITVAINKKNMTFIICHELMHLIGLTWDRGTNIGLYNKALDEKEKAKHQLWNIATDYEINALLNNNEETDGMGDSKPKPLGIMPEIALYESKYKDMTAEKIYEQLLEEYEQNPEKTAAKFSFDDQDGDGHGNQDGAGVALDRHIPMMDDTTRNEVIAKIAEVFGSRSNGLGSSALQRMVDTAYEKQPFNWRRALTKYIKSWVKNNYTWSRPSRAGIANGLILPSAGTTPKMHIAVAVDTSGSISKVELQTMMNHLFTILSQFKDFQVDVWCCGSTVYLDTFRTYTANNKNDLVNFPIQSDGGNDMRENFKLLHNYPGGKKPDLFMCMSDFYDPLDGDTTTTSPCPCIWMVLDHEGFVPPKLIKAETYPFEVEGGK